MKKQDVLNKAEEFFRDNINGELRRNADWECWESAALAIIAIYLQQDLKEISFKQIYNCCQYRELVRLAELLTWSGTADDVQTVLHVCRNRQAHKKFFSVVKACFENKAGNIPYFGKIDEENTIQKNTVETVDLEKVKREAEKKGWHAGFDAGKSGYMKFAYKSLALGLLGGAVIVLWTVYFIKF